MKRLVLYAGTYLNKGGAAIAHGTLQTLKKLNIDYNYIIDPEPFPETFFDNYNIEPIYRYSDIMCNKPINSLSSPSLVRPFINCLLKSHCSQIKNLNGTPIWHIGDSPFSDQRSAFSIVGQVFALKTLKSAVKGKVIIGGISLSYPRTKIGESVLKPFFVNGVDFTFVRGKQTKEVLKEFGVPDEKMSMICDFAYHLNKKETNNTKKLSERISCNIPVIALIVRDHSSDKTRDTYIQRIKQLYGELVKKNYKVFFIPTSYSFFTPENDLIFIKEQLGVNGNHIINIRDLSPEEIISVFGNFDTIISVRLHGAVLGTLAHVPTIHLFDGRKSLEVIGDIFGDSVPLIKLNDFIDNYEKVGLSEIITQAVCKKDNVSNDLKASIDRARESSIHEIKSKLSKIV
jgi:polysaccharide pyruvyl transferase WcaK-like protein